MFLARQREPIRRVGTILVLMVTLLLPLLVRSQPSAAAPSQAELERARDRLLELERDFELVSERYNLVHDRLVDLQASIAVAEDEVDRIERRMSSKQDAAIDLATELYKGGSAGAIEVVLSSQSLNDIDTDLRYLQESEKQQTKVFETLAVDRKLLQQKIAELDAKRQKAAAEEKRLTGLRTEIESKVDAQRDEITRLNELIERAEAREARRQARLERQRARAAEAEPDPDPVTSSISHPPAPNPQAQTAVDAALSQVGKPYQWGAAGPDSYDCSGLTMWAWAQAGVSLPHNSGAQYSATARVDRSDLQPGDLLFYGSPIHHVGMYIGNGQMVEAPYTGSSVRVASISRSDYVGAGRP